ncbi:MAG: PP2C family protein-serine/threonine phosphatase [Terracidiphilus sp.]|jgi:sigma-B regulation protein RsbU (phosphoserine phosphatase)
MFGRFLREQSVYLALAGVGDAIFWAIGRPINPATVLVYALCFGNLFTLATDRLDFLYRQRPFPNNLLVFLPLLLVLTVPFFLIASAFVWLLAPPAPQTFIHLIRTGWKFPFLAMFLCGALTFLFTATREQLERRNIELQHSVESGTARIKMQEQELERAREIQQSLLPKQIPQIAGFEVAGAWRPARMVSGDYFDVLRLGDRRLAVCIADVVGKGVSAALLMANVQAAVRAFACESESPAWVCARVNGLLCENIATGKFVTFLYGVLDCETHRFEFCNAGHLLPILISSGSVRMPEQGGAVLGVFPAWKYEDSSLELKPGDRLLLFTDGITEACDADGREYEEGSIASFARANSALGANELTTRLLAQVTDYCGGQFQDDATLLVIAAS